MTDLKNQLLRLLKAISLLSAEGGRSIRQLEQALEVSNKTAYRYKEVLEESGFRLAHDPATNRYHLPSQPKGLRPNLSFTAEEVDTVMRALESQATKPVRAAICDKLYVHSDLLTVPNRLLAAQFGANVAQVQQAIKERRRIWLRDYRSANSGQITNREVDPVDLQDHYRRLYAHDPQQQQVVQFKLERVGRVEITDQPCRYTHPTAKVETDVFWFNGATKTRTTLHLSLAAHEMMREEYPRIAEAVRAIGPGHYHFETDLYSFLVVGSWILRLPGKIDIIGPPELVDHVRAQLRKHPFS